MTLTIKRVGGPEPRHSVFIGGVYYGAIRKKHVAHGRLWYVYEPTDDAPIMRDRSYQNARLGDLVFVMRQHLQARVAS